MLYLHRDIQGQGRMPALGDGKDAQERGKLEVWSLLDNSNTGYRQRKSSLVLSARTPSVWEHTCPFTGGTWLSDSRRELEAR